MTKHLRITVEGKVYDVMVEDVTEDAGSTFYQTADTGMSVPTTPVAAPAPAPAPAAAPAAAAPAAGAGDVLAPLGGVILEISVSQGAAVTAGQQVAVLEAMKMKQIVTSDHGGTVSQIHVKVGDAVDAGQPLISIG